MPGRACPISPAVDRDGWAVHDRSDLERLANTCADIHLAPGEFAVHEGGERALYAVLEVDNQRVRQIS
jgi:hypothetical protein